MLLLDRVLVFIFDVGVYFGLFIWISFGGVVKDFLFFLILRLEEGEMIFLVIFFWI